MLGEAGDRQGARHGAERQHELAPAERLHSLVRLDRRGLRLEVDGVHGAEDKLGVRAHDAQRHDAVARLERPRRGLRQQRRVEHEVLLAHDGRAALAELARNVGAGKAATDHEHATLGLSVLRLSRFGHVP